MRISRQIEPPPPPGGEVRHQFAAPLTDVFQLQADIATKTADTLGVALAGGTHRSGADNNSAWCFR